MSKNRSACRCQSEFVWWYQSDSHTIWCNFQTFGHWGSTFPDAVLLSCLPIQYPILLVFCITLLFCLQLLSGHSTIKRQTVELFTCKELLSRLPFTFTPHSIPQIFTTSVIILWNAADLNVISFISCTSLTEDIWFFSGVGRYHCGFGKTVCTGKTSGHNLEEETTR